MTEAFDPQHVLSRRVFYIPGYDPVHPRRYRELYRKESADQAVISGYEINLTPKPNDERYGWHVSATIDGIRTETDIETLIWSDIVRKSMKNTIPATYLQLVRTAWTYISSGALRRLTWLRKGPVIAALYPVAMLILQALLAFLAFWLVARLSFVLVHGAMELITGPMVSGPLFTFRMWLSLSLGATAGYVLLRWFKSIDNKLYAYYLMHDFAFSAQRKGANSPELEARMAAFGAIIGDALDSDVDEVLIVGHSSGAHLAVSILADLIRAGRVPADGPALGFLSLGEVIPMVSFLPAAWRLRADLHYLSTRRELTWVDVTAPGDGCAFALCDPVAVTGVAPADQIWPLVVSAAFTQTLTPEKWQDMRWQFFRLHFQYLCAFDRPGDYDYFRITAGPQTLADRYRERAPSASRIDVPVSCHTSTAA